MATDTGRPNPKSAARRPDVSRSGIPTRAGRAAVGLRLAGATFTEVADTLGLPDRIAARDLIEKELASYDDDPAARDRLRDEEAARIERLLRGVWGKAVDPENPEHLPSVRTALALIDRHARLLGLDRPQEMVVYTPTTSEIDTWVTQVIAGRAVVDVEETDVLAIEP